MAEKLLEPDMVRRLEQLALVSRKVAAGHLRGERRSRRRGSSADFADYRNYVMGDDLRFLDWKIYARLERLFLKLFLEEQDLRVHILLDASPSMTHGEPQKLLYAKRVAAAVGYICMNKMDTLCTYAFADGIRQSFGPRRGKVNGNRYFSFLEQLEAGTGTSLQASLKAFAQSTRGKGLVVVISDFFDYGGYEEALRYLFGRDFEVLVIHLLAPDELKPELKGDLRLVDCEFGFTTDVSIGGSLLDLYQRTLQAFCNGIKQYVTQRGGCYLLTSTALPFDKLVLEVLCRRGMIR